MCAEPFHAVLLHFVSFNIFADTSLTIASFLWWCHLCTRDSTIAINFVMVGLPAYQLRHLETVLNAAAHLVYRLRCYDHVTNALATLHWLHLPECVDFTVAVTAFRVLHGLAPPYLCQLARVTDLPGHRRLCSSSSQLVQIHHSVGLQWDVARFL